MTPALIFLLLVALFIAAIAFLARRECRAGGWRGPHMKHGAYILAAILLGWIAIAALMPPSRCFDHPNAVECK